MIKYWVLKSLKRKILRSRMDTSLLLLQRSPKGTNNLNETEMIWFMNEFEAHDNKLAAINLLMEEL